MSDTILAIRDLRAGYGGEDILRGVSIAVPRGRIVAIIGPNGSGKSTFLKAIYGLVPLRGGEVTFIDAARRVKSLAGLHPHAVTALGVNMVPQIANVFGDLTVMENLEIGAVPMRHRFAEQIDKVFAALPLLRPLSGRRAAVLSGGQRQMLAFGRALMSDPQLLILDEPSAGLAPKIREEVFAKVTAVNALGVSILMVEQKARQCLAIADYGYVVEQGRNRLEGRATDLLADPQVVQLYLGGGSGAAADPSPNREGST